MKTTLLLPLLLLLSYTTPAQFSEADRVFPGIFQPRRIIEGDIDGDNDIDLICHSDSYLEDRLVIFYNIGDDENYSKQTLKLGVASINHLRTGDIDEDGDLDIIYSDNAGPFSNIYLIRNLGSESFGEIEIIVPEDDKANTIEFIDIDGDLDLDVLFILDNDDAFRWVENTDGNGDFSEPHLLLDPFSTVFFQAIHDFNQDGREDILFTASPNTLYWLEIPLDISDPPTMHAITGN